VLRAFSCLSAHPFAYTHTHHSFNPHPAVDSLTRVSSQPLPKPHHSFGFLTGTNSVCGLLTLTW
jgi:hypothetical protein